MAKHKKRKKKGRKRKRHSQENILKYDLGYKTSLNRHHLLWTRKKWSKDFWAQKLRTHDYLVASIPAHTIHRLIHEIMPGVPVPSNGTCRSVYWQLCESYNAGHISLDDPPGLRLDTLIALFGESAKDTVEALILERAILRNYEGRLK